MPIDFSSPTVRLAGIAALSIAALMVIAPSFDAESPADVRRDTKAGKDSAARRRVLDRIDAKKETLDERFDRVRGDRKAAEARAASLSGKAAKRAESSAARLRRTEEQISRHQDQLEEKYQSVANGRVSPKVVRMNPASPALVEKAIEQSREFHGNPNAVVELNPKDREIGPLGVVMGKIEAITYAAPRGSERAGAPWEHATGDRGAWQPSAKNKPLLVADPATGRVHIIQDRSPMTFDPERGLVG